MGGGEHLRGAGGGVRDDDGDDGEGDGGGTHGTPPCGTASRGPE
jgi:hypothetical protein